MNISIRLMQLKFTDPRIPLTFVDYDQSGRLYFNRMILKNSLLNLTVVSRLNVPPPGRVAPRLVVPASGCVVPRFVVPPYIEYH